MKIRGISVVLVGVLIAGIIYAEKAAPQKNTTTANELKAFLVSHFRSLEAQDVERAISHLHSKGKNREGSIQDLRTRLPVMAFKFELLSFNYIGSDGEFHYVRYKQLTLFDEKWREAFGVKGIELDCLTIVGTEVGMFKIYDTYLFGQKELKG